MKRSHYLPILLIGLGASSLFGAAPNPSKVNFDSTTHNIGGNSCKGCHAPHNGAAAFTAGGDQNTGKILLWSRAFPGAANTYNLYSSPAMVTAGEVTAGPTLTGTTTAALQNTDVRMYTLLCLSCHDGVTSGASMLKNVSSAVGSALTLTGATIDSGGLANDHPVGINYDPSKNSTGLVDTVTVSGKLPLFSSNGGLPTIQCATCHDPHNNDTKDCPGCASGGAYLRQANNSTHCNTCHGK